jgi:hypothetical protein
LSSQTANPSAGNCGKKTDLMDGIGQDRENRMQDDSSSKNHHEEKF